MLPDMLKIPIESLYSLPSRCNGKLTTILPRKTVIHQVLKIIGIAYTFCHHTKHVHLNIPPGVNANYHATKVLMTEDITDLGLGTSGDKILDA